MTDAFPPFTLRRRAVIRVKGPDAARFLDGLLTVDASDVRPGAPRPAALLTPQGKILHELVVHAESADGGDVALDLPLTGAEDLIKRLALYKLRADVAVEDVTDETTVVVDARGVRRVDAEGEADEPLEDELAAFDAWRVRQGRPEQGVDYGAGEVFPADVNLDLLGGVDYAKGCFIGQEVVSRMKRRGSIRRRTLVMTLDGGPPAKGAEIMSRDVRLGHVMSSAGGATLALVRLDRLADADPSAITVEGRPARITFPDWFPEDAKRVGGGGAA